MWKLGKIEELIRVVDGNARGAVIRVCSGGRHSIVLRRPVQRLFPLEVKATTSSVASDNSAPSRDGTSVESLGEHVTEELQDNVPDHSKPTCSRET